MFLQRLLLRALLSYRGWMYDTRGPSLPTKLWAVLLKGLYFGVCGGVDRLRSTMPMGSSAPYRKGGSATHLGSEEGKCGAGQ
jgi:hypothetical protein